MKSIIWIRPGLFAAAALCGAILAEAAFAQTTPTYGNAPHPSATQTAGCNAACQNTETDLVWSVLNGQVNTLIAQPSFPAGQQARDLVNAALGTYLNSPTDTRAANWIVQAFGSNFDGNGDVCQVVAAPPAACASSNDKNTTEFTMFALGAMLAGGRVTWTQIQNASVTLNLPADKNIIAALSQLHTHTNPGSGTGLNANSTNVYLLNSTAKILVAQALNSQLTPKSQYTSTLQEGEDQLYAYIIYVKKWGVHEFDSSEYAATQMEALAEGYMYAPISDRPNYKAALDYLWLDNSLNFFQPNIRTSPPYSRSYDFQAGQGYTSVWDEVIGGWMSEEWNADKSKIIGSGILNAGYMNLEGANLYDLLLFNNAATGNTAYVVPPAYFVLATQTGQDGNPKNPYRVLNQQWGQPTNDTNPAHLPVRYSGIFGNLTVGCTSGWYGPQDKLLGVGIAGPTDSAGPNREQTYISSVLDSTGSPYGTIPVGKTGSSKPDHEEDNPVCAFWAGGTQAATVVSSFFDANTHVYADVDLSMNILFPIDTAYPGGTNYPQLRVNGGTIDTRYSSSGTTLTYSLTFDPAHPGNTNVVTWTAQTDKGQLGGVVGFKLLDVSPTPTSPMYFQVELDQDGNGGTGPNYNGLADKTGRITFTLRPGGHGGTAVPTNVVFAVLTDDTTTDWNPIFTALKNATYAVTPDDGNGNRVAVTTFPSGTFGGSFSSLGITRSNSVYTDLGSVKVNGSTPSAPASPLVTYDPTNPGVTTDQSTKFWTANPVTNPNPKTFTCTQPLCTVP